MEDDRRSVKSERRSSPAYGAGCGWFRRWLPPILLVLLAGAAAADEPDLLALSQAALGRAVPDAAFVDSEGTAHRLSDYRGKPLLISLVFTSCADSCSVGTRQLDRVVRIARAALGAGSFAVVTIGFDRPVDSPEAMRAFAVRHGVRDPGWQFLSSADPAGLEDLMTAVGFYREPSPRGFDHTVQLTLIDAEGIVYRQVYGEVFEAQQLVEPLKELVLGRPRPDDGMLARLGKRVRLLCTVYDARGDRYLFDYSLFIGMLAGVLVLGAAAAWLVVEIWRKRSRA
ncbi:MAG: SCO family protein [Gammaproteobacteria bacterium]|nr:MAG: SCO family protein [Gammaproteobacteria bacterium]